MTLLRRFRCNRCGDQWEEDPRLSVPCPTCHARAGSRCRRPSGHSGLLIDPHAARKRAAFEAKPCRCLAIWEAQQGSR